MKTAIKNREHYTLNFGLTKDEQLCFSLLKTHYEDGKKMDQPKTLKSWYFSDYHNDKTKQMPSWEEIDNEILINDWSRWNKELPKDQKVEISESIYFDLLGCLPPVKCRGDYFEVGEPSHHENGKAIHRACWKEGEQFFTGYPR